MVRCLRLSEITLKDTTPQEFAQAEEKLGVRQKSFEEEVHFALITDTLSYRTYGEAIDSFLLHGEADEVSIQYNAVDRYIKYAKVLRRPDRAEELRDIVRRAVKKESTPDSLFFHFKDPALKILISRTGLSLSRIDRSVVVSGAYIPSMARNAFHWGTKQPMCAGPSTYATLSPEIITSLQQRSPVSKPYYQVTTQQNH